jgi:endogenous inhibitor of DNA gyrase (YacG/DUF329 family)
MRYKCPRCGNQAPFEGNPFRPFCGERCKMIDLGKWITEVYQVPDDKDDEGKEREPPPSPGSGEQ